MLGILGLLIALEALLAPLAFGSVWFQAQSAILVGVLWGLYRFHRGPAPPLHIVVPEFTCARTDEWLRRAA